MNKQLKSNLLSKKHWSRLVFMLIVSMVLYITFFVTWIVIFAQFTFSLITGNDNDNLRRLGASLAIFIRQSVSFLTYSDDVKPFPFKDWPQPEDVDIKAAEPHAADEKTDAEEEDKEEEEEQAVTYAHRYDEQAQDDAVDAREENETPSFNKDDSFDKYDQDKREV